MENLSVTDARLRLLEDNLKKVRDEIAETALKSGRDPREVKLMAVTKTVSVELINHAIACGVDLIGENKVQEFLSKKEYLKLENCKAHLIGHLQTNKVKQIVSQVSMIQSVDSLKLAREIEKQSQKLGVVTDCLIEVNVGGEESKTGIDFSGVLPLLEEISSMSAVSVKGLMAIPPICEEKGQLCKYFEKMHRLFVDIKAQNIDNINMQILSMGMSGDYNEAILCGANLVRIGSSIFGPRLY